MKKLIVISFLVLILYFLYIVGIVIFQNPFIQNSKETPKVQTKTSSLKVQEPIKRIEPTKPKPKPEPQQEKNNNQDKKNDLQKEISNIQNQIDENKKLEAKLKDLDNQKNDLLEQIDKLDKEITDENDLLYADFQTKEQIESFIASEKRFIIPDKPDWEYEWDLWSDMEKVEFIKDSIKARIEDKRNTISEYYNKVDEIENRMLDFNFNIPELQDQNISLEDRKEEIQRELNNL